MYIKSLEYYDADSEWQLLSLELNQPLTLLVGASGVGKTQILHSLLTLQQIANGRAFSGIQWKIAFDVDKNRAYTWEGKFENQSISLLKDKIVFPEPTVELPELTCEKLTLNDSDIFVRNGEETLFKSRLTIKLTSHQSMLKLITEDDVSLANQDFSKIRLSGEKFSFCPDGNREFISISTAEFEKYNSLEKVKESKKSAGAKLFLAYQNVKEAFEWIKQDFLAVFPHVEDLKVELIQPFNFADEIFPVVYIKEKGVTHWIGAGKISSGMLRTLMFIIEIHLCADGSVILIDEFENSLGVNCIDTVTDFLTNHERDLQFIITTHHPYIINHIPSKYWKLVTRQAGKVTTRDASEFNLGNSKHEAFIQLMNLDEYNEGVAV